MLFSYLVSAITLLVSIQFSLSILNFLAREHDHDWVILISLYSLLLPLAFAFCVNVWVIYRETERAATLHWQIYVLGFVGLALTLIGTWGLIETYHTQVAEVVGPSMLFLIFGLFIIQSALWFFGAGIWRRIKKR